jgi:hypothetical protein
MEKIKIENDIKVFYVTAASYPAGIMEAHQSLHSLVPFSYERKYFGLSRPEHNGGIVYRAATEETYDGEAAEYDCETLVIKKGDYISIIVSNYRKDLPSIGIAFQKLLTQPNIDPQGYCVEWYLSEHEVNCMVRLGD